MQRPLRMVGLALLAGLIVVALVALLVSLFRVPGEQTAIAVCRAAYARARTAAESAAVDLQQPVISRPQAPVALRCGARRAAGQLR